MKQSTTTTTTAVPGSHTLTTIAPGSSGTLLTGTQHSIIYPTIMPDGTVHYPPGSSVPAPSASSASSPKFLDMNVWGPDTNVWSEATPVEDRTNPYHYSLENEEVRKRWTAALVKEVFDTLTKGEINPNRRAQAEADHADALTEKIHGRLLALEVLEPYESIGGEKRPDREKIYETTLGRKLEELRERSDETIEMAPGVWKYAIDEIKKMLSTEEQ